MTQQDWGNQGGKWPGKWPWATTMAVVAGLVAFVASAAWLCNRDWTFLQQRYLGVYVWSQATPWKTSTYELLYRVDGKARRLAVDADGADVQQHKATLAWSKDEYDNGKLRAWIGEAFYQGRAPWTKLADVRCIAFGALAAAVALWWAIPKDRERRRIRREGRRLRGPELLTTQTFNDRNRSDGISYWNDDRSWWRRLLASVGLKVDGLTSIPELQIPRAREAMHTLIMGDSGTGKSTLIKQLLYQIAVRGETAIVYDPALEYTPRFFLPERGDVILNPLDQRMPYWSPGDEVTHEAEAATIAASLFPDTRRENPFFVEGPRKVFAHLLTLRPSPQDLVSWLSHPEEIDRRVRGTELASLIDRSAAPQRAGVLASLSMVGDALRLLPAEEETESAWSAAEWGKKQRKGWIFITSAPAYRERLRPLMSLWLDLLVLRLMNEGMLSRGGTKTWFVLDELASLQKLPQLHTAITENRKSGNPVVLGLQGRSQLETRYGHDAETMLSQPKTKIFLRTSEPHSARWISDTIGEVEVERLRQSRTSGEFPNQRASRGLQLERHIEPLVIPSQIMGLRDLHGYLKSDNDVVRLSFPPFPLLEVQPGFVPRATPPTPEPGLPPTPTTPLEPGSELEPAFFE